MTAIDTLRDALYGNPPVEGYKPDRSGTLQAFTMLQEQVSAQLVGVDSYETFASLPTVTSADNGMSVRVYADPDPGKNVFWIVEGGTWVVDQDLINVVGSIVQPLLDETENARDDAVVAAASAVSASNTSIDAAEDAENARDAAIAAGITTPNNAIVTNVLVAAKTDIAALSGEQTIEGLLTSASFVLLTAQVDQSENGLWLTGAAGWVRYQSAKHVQGLLVIVEGGSTSSGQWKLVTSNPIVLDTTDLEFVQIVANDASRIFYNSRSLVEELRRVVNISDYANDVKAAVDALPDAGGIVVFEAGSFDSKYSNASYFGATNLLRKNDVIFWGAGIPNYSVDNKSLVGGTIIDGSLFVVGQRFRMFNMGVNVGETWCLANNAGNPSEGIIFPDRARSGVDGFTQWTNDEPTREFGHLHNVKVLSYKTGRTAGAWGVGTSADTSDVHAVLCENSTGGKITRLFVRYAGAGVVLKISNLWWDSIFAGGNFKYNLLQKDEGQTTLGGSDNDNDVGYSHADGNRGGILTIENLITQSPDINDPTHAQDGGYVVESATGDAKGSTVKVVRCTSMVNNAVTFTRLSTFETSDHDVGLLDVAYTYGYAILTTGPAKRCRVNRWKTLGGRFGALLQAGCEDFILSNPKATGISQYILRNYGVGTIVENPDFNATGFGHYRAEVDSSLYVVGTAKYDGVGGIETIIGNGVIRGNYNSNRLPTAAPTLIEKRMLSFFYKTTTKIGAILRGADSVDREIAIGQRVAVPPTGTTPGSPGDFAASATFIYIYTGDGTTHSWSKSAATVH